MSLIGHRSYLRGFASASLLLAAAAAIVSAQTTQGPGDVREGYERADYQTNSASLTSRRGTEADLLTVITTPPLGVATDDHVAS